MSRRRHKRWRMSVADAHGSYGWTWGQVSVVRAAEHRGYRVLRVQTDHRAVDITVSPAGRTIRVRVIA